MTNENDQLIPAAEGPTLTRIAQQVFGQPLLLHPGKAEIIGHVLAGRVGLDRPPSVSPEASQFIGSFRREDRERGMSRAVNGVAMIPIIGTLVNRGAWIGASSGLVSYEGLAAQISDAAADPEIHTIILDIDSPGGSALGMSGIVETVVKARDQKPVIAFVNDMAASGAYAIAASATEIVISKSSVVGSIGVVMVRVDMTGAMEQQGIKAEVFHAGSFKTDGHPFTEMDEQEAKRATALINSFYDLFVQTVVAGRGNRITEEQVRGTEAGVYIGEAAITAGLADRVASLSEVLDFQMARGAATRHQGAISMTTDNQTPQAGASTEGAAPITASLDKARAEGATAERERIGAILTCEAAEGREAQARMIALETDMTPEVAA
ncbi:MAG: S49 family peptidase, partial [Loktanella sp.]|nr:S49 family peptidase [Loktanella sp.]